MSVSISSSARGFALPVVLLTLVAIGALAVTIIPKGMAGVVDVASFERRAQERLLIEAGLARGILALMAPNDPMAEELRKGEAISWTFAGRALSIDLQSESAKLDLNAADPGALAATLNRALGTVFGPKAFDVALAQRGRLTSPDQILPLPQRFSQFCARLREVVTVYGGRVDDLPARSSDERPMAIVSERPIYTVRARLAGGFRARTVTILIEPEVHRYAILDREELHMDDYLPGQ